MRRRDFFLGLAALAVPRSAIAQPKTPSRIGFLHSAAPDQITDLLTSFRAGLQQGGFVEGQNIAIDYRWANNDSDRLPELAEELVAANVALIAAAGGDRSAMAARHATATIPIVSVIGGDPIAEGLVRSLAHPGGNLTGVAFLTASLTAKRLQLLLEIAPGAKVVAMLVNSTNPQRAGVVADLRAATLAKGLAFHAVEGGSEPEVEHAFEAMAKLHADILVIQADPYFNNIRAQLIALCQRYRLPAIHERGAFVAEGGLISYGTSLPDVYRLVGSMAARVLRGAKPADLPVEQPTRFELAVNLKTAKALGLSVPQTILAGADEVIE